MGGALVCRLIAEVPRAGSGMLLSAVVIIAATLGDSPATTRAMAFALGVAAMGFFAVLWFRLAVLEVRSEDRGWERLARGSCPDCGYGVRWTPRADAVCPECGWSGRPVA